MSYADFSFYKTDFLGEAISDENTFNRLALRASSFLDYYTMGKAAKNPELSALKMACCAVAEQVAVLEKASGESAIHEKQSETVGSYSVSYRSGVEVAESARAQMASVAKQHLAGTGLLYRGGCVCTLHTL